MMFLKSRLLMFFVIEFKPVQLGIQPLDSKSNRPDSKHDCLSWRKLLTNSHSVEFNSTFGLLGRPVDINAAYRCLDSPGLCFSLF